MNSSKLNYILIVTSIVLGILLYYKGYKGPDGSEELNKLQKIYEASEARATHYKTKSGQDSTDKQIMIGTIEELKQLHTKDSTLLRLEKMVNKNTIGAMALNTTTQNTIENKTTVIIPKNEIVNHDTIKCKCDTSCYPTYGISYKNEWENVDATATKNTFKIDYTIFEKYDIAQEFKQEGKWYNRKQVPYVSVKSLNPHTSTTNVQSFHVEPPKQDKITLGLGATYGYDLFTFKPALTIGGTINFRILGF